MNSVFDIGDDDINFVVGRGLVDEKNCLVVRNIWIFNNYFVYGYGVVVVGSYIVVGIEDILVEDNVLNGIGFGFCCKLVKGVGGGV